VTALLLFWQSWKFEIELGAIALFVSLVTFDIVSHLERVGAEKCESANTDARVAELVRDATARTRDAELINREASTYAQTLAAPLGAPVFAAPGLCTIAATSSRPRRVPTTAAPGRLGDGAAALPGVDRGGDLGAVLVPETLRNTGREADAQVVELQSYIRDVCRPLAAN